MTGWMGTILRINLSNGAVTTEPLNTKDAALFLGARGLGVKIFTDEVDAAVDPLSPENKLVFAPGPFTGTRLTRDCRSSNALNCTRPYTKAMRSPSTRAQARSATDNLATSSPSFLLRCSNCSNAAGLPNI